MGGRKPIVGGSNMKRFEGEAMGKDGRRLETKGRLPKLRLVESARLSESSSTGQRHPGQAVETGVYDRRWTTKYRTDATIACSAELFQSLRYKRDCGCRFREEGRKRGAFTRESTLL